MIVAGVSGSAVSDVSGIGKMETEAMEEHGCDRPFSAAVTAASSTIAPIIPPGASAVLYGSITGVSIGKLLIGGLGLCVETAGVPRAAFLERTAAKNAG